jgi:hypothetical protein
VTSQRLFELAAPKRLRVITASSSVYGNATTFPTREDASLRPVSTLRRHEGGLRVACPDCERLAGKRLKVIKEGTARGDVGRTEPVPP